MLVKHIDKNNIEIKERQMRERVVRFMIFLVGWLMLSLSLVRYDIVCLDKHLGQAKRCTLERTLSQIIRKEIHLGDLRGAFIRPFITRDDRKGLLYSVKIETSQGLESLSPVPSLGKRRKQRIVNEIEHFIDDSSTLEIKLTNPQPKFIIFISSFILLMGFILVTITDTIAISIDKASQKILIRWRNLYRKTSRTIAIGDLKRVDVESKINSKGTRTFRLAFVLNNNQSVPLVNSYRGFFNYKKSVADELNKLLNIKAIISKGGEVHHSRKRLIFFVVGIIILISAYFVIL